MKCKKFSISFKEIEATGGMTKIDEWDMTNQGTQGKGGGGRGQLRRARAGKNLFGCVHNSI